MIRAKGPRPIAAALVPVIALSLLLASAPGASQVTDPAPLDSIVVGSGVRGSTGAIGVNAAAGNNNQQANARVVAIGDTAIASGQIVQTNGNAANARSSIKVARIDDGAFAGSSGLLAVNVVAGSDNQQANLAVIAIGIEGLVATDTMLSQARASHQPVGELAESDAPEAVTEMGLGAFADSSGLVQVSLIGGERNTSANTFTLTISDGGKP